jgi:threonine synthase
MMQFYSTNNRNLRVGLREAVMHGLAPDNGLYMPVSIPLLSDPFFATLSQKSFQELSFDVASNLLGADLPSAALRKMIDHAIQFDAPLVKVEAAVSALELFHGPTLAFKDFGARFLSGLVGYFAEQQDKEITILVATSGDTGSAVANGFLNVPGTKVIVLYPAGKVSELQEKQFTTLGGNITALEVEGTFDDCQQLVKEAFLDTELNQKQTLTSANSINIARLIPQTFYYFYAFGQVKHPSKPVVFSVPSGNFGNLTAGLMAKRMGLPITKMIAATNVNSVVPEYFKTRIFSPRPSQQTISNAMDVGNPSNFARMLDLYDHHFERLASDVEGYYFSDDETRAAMRQVLKDRDYRMDPHGAVGYLGLKKYIKSHRGAQGIFLETAHPGKFKEVVEETLGQSIELPEALIEFSKREKKSLQIGKEYQELRDILGSL